MSDQNSFLGNAHRRAFGAWLLACYVAGVLMTLGFGVLSLLEQGGGIATLWRAFAMAPFGGFYLGMFVIMLTALPMPILTGLVRWQRWPRPLSDLVVGAVMGGGLIQVLGAPLVWSRASGEWRMEGLLLTGMLALCGAVSGWVYWRVAGRPGRVVNAARQAIKRHVFD